MWSSSSSQSLCLFILHDHRKAADASCESLVAALFLWTKEEKVLFWRWWTTYPMMLQCLCDVCVGRVDQRLSVNLGFKTWRGTAEEENWSCDGSDVWRFSVCVHVPGDSDLWPLSLPSRRLHLHKKRSEVKQSFVQLAGVSLLKPLKGVDPNLISNLETFFTLDYPKVTAPPAARSPLLCFRAIHPNLFISSLLVNIFSNTPG